MVIVIVIGIVRGRVRVRARTEVRIRANFGVKGRVMVRLGLGSKCLSRRLCCEPRQTLASQPPYDPIEHNQSIHVWSNE